jgi:hypothetical protein
MKTTDTAPACECGSPKIWIRWTSDGKVEQDCQHTVDRFRALYGEPKQFTVHTEKPE